MGWFCEIKKIRRTGLLGRTGYWAERAAAGPNGLPLNWAGLLGRTGCRWTVLGRTKDGNRGERSRFGWPCGCTRPREITGRSWRIRGSPRERVGRAEGVSGVELARVRESNELRELGGAERESWGVELREYADRSEAEGEPGDMTGKEQRGRQVRQACVHGSFGRLLGQRKVGERKKKEEEEKRMVQVAGKGKGKKEKKEDNGQKSDSKSDF
ncbi:hypothetical protein CRG98_026670 [Punica granatum]|uniref:Uncharacterized protein n=1 Tax=Punica granatum TaxID=22663 RepID=A0A2I0J9P4_PUNGR|nr:hypothetical protein CRG98_026670 [Punica granatum]